MSEWVPSYITVEETALTCTHDGGGTKGVVSAMSAVGVPSTNGMGVLPDMVTHFTPFPCGKQSLRET